MSPCLTINPSFFTFFFLLYGPLAFYTNGFHGHQNIFLHHKLVDPTMNNFPTFSRFICEPVSFG